MTIAPSVASSRASIARISSRIDCTDSGTRWFCSASINADMWVPFVRGQRHYMSTVAIEVAVRPARNLHRVAHRLHANALDRNVADVGAALHIGKKHRIADVHRKEPDCSGWWIVASVPGLPRAAVRSLMAVLVAPTLASPASRGGNHSLALRGGRWVSRMPRSPPPKSPTTLAGDSREAT